MSKGYKIRNPEGIFFLTFAVVEWVDVFTRKEYADIVIESLKYCQEEKGLVLYGWCLMPNHLHIIAAPKPTTSLAKRNLWWIMLQVFNLRVTAVTR